MTHNDISSHHQTFESIRHYDSENNEFWLARQLFKILEYSEFRSFLPVIDKAKKACKNSGHIIKDHFGDITEMVDIGTGARREIMNIKLSRYACYLIVQNGDPSKLPISIGQTYFATQTRRQELTDNENLIKYTENDRRLMLRGELVEHNKTLTAAAKDAGVLTHLDYAIFQEHGYKGLYGGLGAKDIHMKKNLKKTEKILDNMGSAELAANLFRATQAEEKLRREKIVGKQLANDLHYKVGSKVRQTIQELGGIMPEQLPTPDKSIRELQREKKQIEEKTE